MSRPQDLHRPFFAFGNPFRMIAPKGSQLSPKLLALLNNFEETLAERLRKLNPKNKDNVLSFSWIKSAIESLCETHKDIKTLITELELPVCDWDEKWIDMYLDISVKLLDICIGFSSELSRLNQGHLFLQLALHNLESSCSEQFVRAQSSFDGWRKHMSSKNPRVENCSHILDSLVESMDLPNVKNSAKGKVLMRAMYGVKVETVFVCRVFAAAFSGSARKLLDLNVSGTNFWIPAFVDLQKNVNGEIRNIISSGKITVLKELEAIEGNIKILYPMIHDGMGPEQMEVLQTMVLDFGRMTEQLSLGLDLLSKEVDCFFEIVLSGRDALLSNLRASGTANEPMLAGNAVKQVVR